MDAKMICQTWWCKTLFVGNNWWGRDDREIAKNSPVEDQRQYVTRESLKSERMWVKLEMKLGQITHFLSIYLSSIFFQCSSIQMKDCPIVIVSSSSVSMATSAQTVPEPLRHEHNSTTINKHMLAAYRIPSIKDGLKLWRFLQSEGFCLHLIQVPQGCRCRK